MTNFYDTVLNILKKDNRFFSTEGEFLRNAVYEAAMKMDPKLIRLLFENADTKARFFTDIDGVFVFDKVGFGWVINNREFLPDSYTRYKNKIGLVNGNGNFISTSNDTELVFPYKDCVLEGGQQKEDQKKTEIFFNATLAPDDVDRMLSPKVLSSGIKIIKNGKKIAKHYQETDNLVVKGNNLLSIASLLPRFEGKIKLIYIDPPYNTGGAANTFAYNNTFNHSTWLTFMKNRLEIAKRLLKNDGSICIAIDDEEYAHLKILCDELFGRDNYIGTIVIQSNPRGRTINSQFATCHEYALFYAKNINLVVINDQELTDEQAEEFGKADKEGKYRLLPFRRSGGTSTPEERPNSEFALYYSTKAKNIIAVGGERIGDHTHAYKPKDILFLNNNNDIQKISPELFFANNKSVITILPVDIYGKRRVWRWSDRKAILLGAQNNNFVISEKDGKYTVQLKDRIKEGRKPKTIWNDSKYDASANGTILLKKIFDGEKLFSYPKSIHTVKDIVNMLTDSSTGDIVLDFFAGSGTTAHAVLELNKADDGNRQFILCEQMDYIETVTVPRIQKVMNQTDSFIYCELAKLNQKYVDRIQDASDEDSLVSLWSEMQATGFISSKIDPKDIDLKAVDFKNLSFKNKKCLLMELLDLNQLYINYCDIDDKTFDVSDQDKVFTRSFYGEE